MGWLVGAAAAAEPTAEAEAAVESAAVPESAAALAEVPVEALILPRLEGLGRPSPPPVGKGVVMAISAASEAAEQAVQAGMLCLHTGWDFQAYRHFCVALRADPQCLMAHWGVGMALLHGGQDVEEAQQAALARMLDLVEDGQGTDLERRYAFGLTRLVTEGPGPAASAFAAAAEQFPDDPQLVLLKCLLSRGGFDLNGEATPDQERAEAEMREVIARFPELTWLRYGYLAMAAEAGELDERLGMARKLAEEAPSYAPYFHLLGHYEWRCGHHGRAAYAFGRAADLYAEWMGETGLGAIDCPAWTKAESYRAVALASLGNYETAVAVAEAVASIEVTLAQAETNGGRMLLWEGKTLPARVLMRRGAEGDLARATKLLPALEEVRGYGAKTLALWSFQIHSSILAGKLALGADDAEAVQTVLRDVTGMGERFVATGQVAAANGERSQWQRAFKAFEVMVSELRGQISMAQPPGERGGAYNWYRSAADRQERATLMMPPAVLLPMEARLGEYYLDRAEPDKAVEVLLEGLAECPQDYELLVRLEAAFGEAGQAPQAAEVRARLDQLRQDW
jgi:tetratricopeptide (TPR) repeat protein